MSVTHSETMISGFDGLRLYTAAHEVDEAKAGVVILHGYCEHSQRYHHVVEAFTQAGLSCYLLEHRGHGRSEGPRAAVKRFDDYLDDLDIYLRGVRERHGDKPLFLLGHSLGGLIAATYVLKRQPSFAGVVLSSPYLGLRIPLPAWKALGGQVISRFFPAANVTSEIDPALLTHDQAIVQDYVSDPDVPKIANARWYTEAAAAQAYCLSHATTWNLPLLLMHGGDDRIANPDASRKLASRIRQNLVKLVVLEGLYHEIFNEIGRDAVIKQAQDWMLDRVAQGGR